MPMGCVMLNWGCVLGVIYAFCLWLCVGYAIMTLQYCSGYQDQALCCEA